MLSELLRSVTKKADPAVGAILAHYVPGPASRPKLGSTIARLATADAGGSLAPLPRYHDISEGGADETVRTRIHGRRRPGRRCHRCQLLGRRTLLRSARGS